MVADPVPAPPNPLKSDLQPTAHAQRLSDYLKGLQQLVKKNTEYPSAARRLNQQGVVLVQVRIRTNGELGEITVLRSSGYVSLDRAAVAALRRSAPFQAPAGFGLGDVLLDVPINFRLL
jgi:protein TonB